MEELRDKIPFHCIITGPTNCGKTKYLIDQLRGPFRKVFEFIVLICPTYLPKIKPIIILPVGDKHSLYYRLMQVTLMRLMNC